MNDRFLFFKKKIEVVKKVGMVESAAKAQKNEKQQHIDKIDAQIKDKRKRMDDDIDYTYDLADDIQCLDEKIVKWTGQIEIAKAQKAGKQEMLAAKRQDCQNINRVLMELEEEKKHLQREKADFDAALAKQINELDLAVPHRE